MQQPSHGSLGSVWAGLSAVLLFSLSWVVHVWNSLIPMSLQGAEKTQKAELTSSCDGILMN